MRKRTDIGRTDALAARILVGLADRPDALHAVTKLVKLLTKRPTARLRDRR